MAQEFEIIRGTSETLICNIVDQDGDAVDLTGYSSISLYADKSLNATSPSLTKSSSSVFPTSGLVFFNFATTDTSSLATGDYFAEVHMVVSTTEYRTTQPFIFRVKQRVKA